MVRYCVLWGALLATLNVLIFVGMLAMRPPAYDELRQLDRERRSGQFELISPLYLAGRPFGSSMHSSSVPVLEDLYFLLNIPAMVLAFVLADLVPAVSLAAESWNMAFAFALGAALEGFALGAVAGSVWAGSSPTRRRVLNRSLAIVLAVVTLNLAGLLLIAIPYTPHSQALKQMRRMMSYDQQSSTETANAAFDEWIRLGERSEFFDAIFLPIVAAIISLIILRRYPPLRVPEIVSLTVMFLFAVLARSSTPSFRLLNLIAACVFAGTLAIGRFAIIPNQKVSVPSERS
jgi:hypothetical protein